MISNDILEIDPFKLMHWLNVRKCTMARGAKLSGLKEALIIDLARGHARRIAAADADTLARALDLPSEELLADGELTPAVYFHTHEQIAATKQKLFRGGNHYYNYYTLPTPKGYVAPVLLDILCPKDRNPELNNGHLEPAITINLGPGEINGIWGEKSEPDAWRTLKAAIGAEQDWIVGDSYIESPYQPHTYSLASDEKARIISYTVKSNLESIVYKTNSWNDARFEEMAQTYDGRTSHAATLLSNIERRGFTPETLSQALGFGDNRIKAFIAGDADALDMDSLKTVGRALGVDYRVLLPVDHVHDSVGKTFWTIADSRSTIRTYLSYTVASMSAAPQHMDMMGLFIKVDNPSDGDVLDLLDSGCAHYYVSGGEMILFWNENDGDVRTQALREGDGFWVGPYVRHGLSGNGALIKMGNGEGINYLSMLELTNTYDTANTLRRCRKDQTVWGYDAEING